jgi:hypothetical protein
VVCVVMRAVAVAVAASVMALGGCSGARTSLLLKVTASEAIAGVDELDVTLTDSSGQPSKPAPYVLKAATWIDATPFALDLQLPAGIEGAVTVGVRALRAGACVASGSGHATTATKVENVVTVTLRQPCVDVVAPTDGFPDLRNLADLSPPQDLALPPDLGSRCPPALAPAMGGNFFWTNWKMPNPVNLGLPNPARYDLGTPGVVVDTVTGLMWQRDVDPGQYTWANAKDYCANRLNLNGCSGWRLPTRIELVSLVDFTVAQNSGHATIDANAFPQTPAETFWSSSPMAGPAGNAWNVPFSNGSTSTLGVGFPLRVRCVR